MMQLTILRKQILDYEIAKYRHEMTPLQITEIEMQIRRDAAAYLHALNPQTSIEECYNSPLLFQDGEFRINNRLYQTLEQQKEEAEPAESASELLLRTRRQQLESDVAQVEQKVGKTNEELQTMEHQIPEDEETEEQLFEQIADLEQSLATKKAYLSELLAEFEALKEKELEIQEHRRQRKLQANADLDRLSLQHSAAEEIGEMLQGMVLTYRELVHQDFEELLSEERNELDNQYNLDKVPENVLSEEELKPPQAPQFAEHIAKVRNAFEEAEAVIDKNKPANRQEKSGLLQKKERIVPGRNDEMRAPSAGAKSIRAITPRNRRIPQVSAAENKIDDVIRSVESAKEVVEKQSEMEVFEQAVVSPTKVEISDLSISSAIKQVSDIPARKMAEYLLKEAEESKPIVSEVAAEGDKAKIEEARRKADERAREYQQKLEEQQKEQIGVKERLLQERDERIEQFKEVQKERPINYKRVKFIEEPEFIDAFSGRKSSVEHKPETKRQPSTTKIPYSMSAKEQEEDDAFEVLRQIEQDVFG